MPSCAMAFSSCASSDALRNVRGEDFPLLDPDKDVDKPSFGIKIPGFGKIPRRDIEKEVDVTAPSRFLEGELLLRFEAVRASN